MKKAVILLSGGLDSAVTLYHALKKGYRPNALIFDYGQRHKKEIECAKKLATLNKLQYHIVKIDLSWTQSSLTNKKISVPIGRNLKAKNIPSTYVAGRNIIFLSYAFSYAESIGADKVFIGAHVEDYSGYPDCRPEFYAAFRKAVARGTKAGAQQEGIKILTPLINKGKADIIRIGDRLGVPFALTWSCYKGGKRPCGECDSCYYRKKGFKEAGINQR